ncbi:MAG: hypothetical protein JOY90_24280 [Bradyrhizobium sp.]|uniref:hypothetical protein n=1 Tax=Bradyrhizobium sp. TaxID=376 RepID=UPI001DF29BF6|nr:hypothetical protein [Bradyrhizobium sp.]MBV9563535.1 hypothetical protein [Bradyrhizobium sp.]
MIGPGARHGRRRLAVIMFRFAGRILRTAIELYRRRAMPRLLLRLALSSAQLLERAGGRLVLGRWRWSQPELTNEKCNGHID